VLLRETIAACLASQPPYLVPQREVQRIIQPTWPGDSASHALVLTGVRRCGKSTLQRQIRQREGGPAVTLQCEDTRLYGLGPEDFATVLSLLDERYPGAVVFLDEAQEAPEWQRLVRALLDEGRRVCVTGSNASLLGRELGAKLTGRHLSHEVYPFSYCEYLSFTGTAAGAASLEGYLRSGGFPGALQAGPEVAPVLLRELLRDVVQRDIVSRHSLRAVRPLMTLALHLIAHSGQPLSLQALSKGLALPSAAQVGRFVEYLQDAWLLLAVPRFSASHRQRVISPPKYYAVDTGLAAANNPNPTPDLGRKLENAILLALRRRGQAPSYAAAPHEWECDFVTPTLAVQACARITPENRARELHGLVHAATLPGSAGGEPRQLLVLTLDQEDTLTEQGWPIAIRPAWSWLD
jgi:predicted AAA+ superfamily ATPase